MEIRYNYPEDMEKLSLKSSLINQKWGRYDLIEFHIFRWIYMKKVSFFPIPDP